MAVELKKILGAAVLEINLHIHNFAFFIGVESRLTAVTFKKLRCV